MHRRSSRAWCNRDIVTEHHVVLQAVSYEFQEDQIQVANQDRNQWQEQNQEILENYEESCQNFELLWPPSAPRSQSEKEPGGQIPIPDQNRQVRPDHSQ